jgi:transcriptional regulator with XRE-family HTH domain
MPNIFTPEYKFMLRRLIEARNASGETQSQVAEKLGKPQSYVSKCESGERRVDVTELQQFAQIYNKPLDYFVKK